MAEELNDFSKLCIHTITNKPWNIEECIKNYSETGIKGITLWRYNLEGRQIKDIRTMIDGCGLEVVSLCRGGFFPAVVKSEREKAICENLRIIDEAAELGAPLIVIVPGTDPELSLKDSRKQIFDGVSSILPYAEKCKIKLGIEPLHPMYADTRSAINTLKQANDICEKLNSDYLGVVVDVYHLWWEADLEKEIIRSGKSGKLFAFHISDWKTPTEDILNDRALMGEGCIPIKKIRDRMEKSTFCGFNEVEIFSNKRWNMNQKIYLDQIKKAYLKFS